MVLQHDALERRASARMVVRATLTRAGHSLDYRPSERLGLVSGRVRRWIKKAYEKLSLCVRNVESDVEMYGTPEDRALMARYNARREESGLAEIDHSVARVRAAVHEATIKRSQE